MKREEVLQHVEMILREAKSYYIKIYWNTNFRDCLSICKVFDAEVDKLELADSDKEELRKILKKHFLDPTIYGIKYLYQKGECAFDKDTFTWTAKEIDRIPKSKRNQLYWYPLTAGGFEHRAIITERMWNRFLDMKEKEEFLTHQRIKDLIAAFEATIKYLKQKDSARVGVCFLFKQYYCELAKGDENTSANIELSKRLRFLFDFRKKWFTPERFGIKVLYAQDNTASWVTVENEVRWRSIEVESIEDKDEKLKYYWFPNNRKHQKDRIELAEKAIKMLRDEQKNRI